MLQPLLDSICQIMNADTVTVLLPAEKEQQLFVCASIGLEEEMREGIDTNFLSKVVFVMVIGTQ